jgi:hypothetical protein
VKISELQQRIGRLKKLIDEPQPGIQTWIEVFGSEMDDLFTNWQMRPRVANDLPLLDDGRRRIFVFGSNTRGVHGKGAAWTAKRHWGAQQYNGYGIQGDAYAIPTREILLNDSFRTLALDDIRFYVNVFIGFAEQHTDWLFLVTRIGCGYAGYEDAQIATMFAGAPDNCRFDPAWALFDLKSWEESPDEYIRNSSARGSEVRA